MKFMFALKLLAAYRSMNRILSVFIMVLQSFASSGQENISAHINPAMQMDTARIESRLRLAREIAGTDIDSSIRLFLEIAEESRKMDYNDGTCFAFMGAGMRLGNQGKYREAEYYFNKAFPYCLMPVYNKALPAYFLNNKSTTYFWQGEHENASKCYFLALKYLEERKLMGSHVAALTYCNIGIIHIRQKQYKVAEFYLEKAEKIAKNIKATYELSLIATSMGNVKINTGRPEEAKKHYEQALILSRKGQNVLNQISALINLGDVHLSGGDAKAAIPFLKEAMALAVKGKIQFAKTGAAINLAEAYYKMNLNEEAEKVLSAELNTAKERGIKLDLVKGYATLAKVYKAMGKYEEALNAQENRYNLNDSLSGIEKLATIHQLDVKYQTAEKDKVIMANMLKIERQQGNIAKKNLWMGLTIAASLIVSVLFLGYYRNNRHERKLQTEQIKSLKQEQEINVLKARMQGEENERSRIAKDLHDGIGGLLSASVMRFNSLTHQHSELTSSPSFNEVRHLLEDMGVEIRKTAHNLVPDILEKLSLAEAITTYCNHIQEGGQLQIDIQAYGDFSKLDYDFQLTAYRIIQELIHNVVKHSEASHAIIQMILHEDLLNITVEDNGKGFNRYEPQYGIGLKNLQSRVHSLKGNFSLESEPGQGTTVFIEFNLAFNPEIVEA
jgi:signal transduction histidine kinase